MSKDEYSAILDKSFDEGTPFINYTEYYSYALIPKGGKWLEVSYDFEEHEIMENNELSETDAYLKLCEEIEKAMSEELEIFYLNKWKDFKGKLEGSEGEMLKALIAEITTNPTTYSDTLPVVLNKDDLSKVKEKL